MRKRGDCDKKASSRQLYSGMMLYLQSTKERNDIEDDYQTFYFKWIFSWAGCDD